MQILENPENARKSANARKCQTILKMFDNPPHFKIKFYQTYKGRIDLQKRINFRKNSGL